MTSSPCRAASACVRAQRVGGVGSQQPLLEGLLLSLGAEHVYVIEFNQYSIDHERITTFASNRFPAGLKLSLIVAIDALQHDGLGRYGDPVCGDGDLQTMKHLRDVSDTLVISVPTGETDSVIWNAHRVYGPLRLPQLLQGWSTLLRLEQKSPILDRSVFVLKTTNGEKEADEC